MVPYTLLWLETRQQRTYPTRPHSPRALLLISQFLSMGLSGGSEHATPSASPTNENVELLRVRRGQQTLPDAKSKMLPQYWKELVAFGESMKTNDPILGEYATLQRVNLIHIQNELADIKADMVQYQSTTESQMLHLRKAMHEYGVCHTKTHVHVPS